LRYLFGFKNIEINLPETNGFVHQYLELLSECKILSDLDNEKFYPVQIMPQGNQLLRNYEVFKIVTDVKWIVGYQISCKKKRRNLKITLLN
jgi:hypothetical protein